MDGDIARLVREVAVLNRKMDLFGRSLLHLARFLTTPSKGHDTMTATTDAIRSRLAGMHDKVGVAAQNIGQIASAAIAAEEAELAAIMSDLDALEAKIEALPQAVVAPPINEALQTDAAFDRVVED